MQDVSSLFPSSESGPAMHALTERLHGMMGNIAALPEPQARTVVEVFASDLISAFHESGNLAYGHGFDAGVRAARPTLLESPDAFPERVIAVASSTWERQCRATMASLLHMVQEQLQNGGAPDQVSQPLVWVSVARAGVASLRQDAPAAPDIWDRLALAALGAVACALDHLGDRDMLETAQSLLCVALSAYAPGDPDL